MLAVAVGRGEHPKTAFSTPDGHVEHVEKGQERLAEASLKLNPCKCIKGACRQWQHPCMHSSPRIRNGGGLETGMQPWRRRRNG